MDRPGAPAPAALVARLQPPGSRPSLATPLYYPGDCSPAARPRADSTLTRDVDPRPARLDRLDPPAPGEHPRLAPFSVHTTLRPGRPLACGTTSHGPVLDPRRRPATGLTRSARPASTRCSRRRRSSPGSRFSLFTPLSFLGDRSPAARSLAGPTSTRAVDLRQSRTRSAWPRTIKGSLANRSFFHQRPSCHALWNDIWATGTHVLLRHGPPVSGPPGLIFLTAPASRLKGPFTDSPTQRAHVPVVGTGPRWQRRVRGFNYLATATR